jgi:hypothetical protein
MSNMRQIELLYFASCPHWQQTADTVRAILADGGLTNSVVLKLISVGNDEEAQRRRFLGSPTIRVNGKDVDPSVDGSAQFGLQCRLYGCGERFVGVPPAAWIQAALGIEPTSAQPASSGSSSSCGGESCR